LPQREIADICFFWNETVLSLQDVVLSRGGRTIIKDLSASADRGDVVAILGPNGAVKTTLLHFIAGVLKSDSGYIYYQGSKIDPASLDWRRRLAYVLDDGGIIPLLTVEEQLYLQSVLVGVSHTESVERTGLVINLLELSKYRNYRGDELSSGLRKRLGIGIGIIRDADVFLFDEPYSSLDVQAMAVFSRIVAALKSRGRIVIVASHSFPFLDNLYNHVWTLSDGAVTDHSNKRELRDLLNTPFQSGSSSRYKEIDIPWILQST
jgi:ABC-type multidrug transport system ATPase subunit